MEVLLRALLDAMAVRGAEGVHEQVHSILNAVTSMDIQWATDRYLRYTGEGYLIGLPTNASTCTLSSGVPTNGVAGYATGAIWINFKGGSGSALYANRGTNTSTTWYNLA